MSHDEHMELEITSESVVSVPDITEVVEVTLNGPDAICGDTENVLEIVQPDPVILSHLACKDTGQGGGTSTGGFADTPHTGSYSNISVNRGFTKLELSWIEVNVPSNAKYTAIWRGDSVNAASAKLIGSTNVPIFVDTINPDKSYYYWVQGVTYGNKTTSLYGPISSDVSQDQEAVLAFLGLSDLTQTLLDLEQRLVDLMGSAREEDLQDLRQQISALQNTIDEKVADLHESISTESATLSASITNERIARVDETSALAKTIETLTATVSSNEAETLAQVTEVTTAFATLDTALAQRMNSLEASVSSADSEVRALIEQESTARSTLSEALATQITTLTASTSTDNADTNSRITEESTVRSTETSTLATKLESLESEFVSKDTATNARISNEIQTRSDEREAIAHQISQMSTRFEGDIADVESSINQEHISRVNAESALASQISDIATEYVDAEQRVNARITEELTSIVTANEAFAESIFELESQFETRYGTISSDIENRFVTLTNEYEAISSSFLDLSASFQNTRESLNQTNAAINAESTARANAVEALATQVNSLDVSFQGLLTDTVANINTTLTTLTNQDSAQAQQLTELEARFDSSLQGSQANFEEEIQTLTDADSALALSITNLSTEWEGLLSDAQADFNRDISTLSSENQSRATEITQLSAHVDDRFSSAVASSTSYTNSQVGYCVIGGNVSNHTDQYSCSANGGSWQKLPLSDAMDRVSISYTGINGNTVTGSAGTLFKTLSDQFGNVNSRAWLGVDVNGRVTGLNVTSNSGHTNKGSIDAIASSFSISHPDTLDKVFFFNTSNREAYFKGRLILSDGTNINNVNDITGATGPQGPRGTSGADGNDGNDAVYGTWEHTQGFSSVVRSDGTYTPALGTYYASYYKFYRGSTLISSGTVRWRVTDALTGAINTYVEDLSGEHVWYELKNDITPRVTVSVRHTSSNTIITQDFYTVFDGSAGPVGPGFYSLVNSSGNFPTSATATSNFISNFGTAPKTNDHLTYHNSAKTNSSTKRFNGSSWTAPTLLVNGDILALGTITGNHIAAGTINAGHIQADTIDTHHLSANAVNASKINVNDLFAQHITATGRITGAELYGADIVGSKISTSSSGVAFRANIEDDGNYILWIGEGSKTDANGTFWIKKDGTGFISGKLFQGEIVERQSNSFYTSGYSAKAVNVYHKSDGKPVTINFNTGLTLEMAGNKTSQASKLRMRVDILRNGVLLNREYFNPSYVEYFFEPEVNENKTIFMFRYSDFVVDTLTSAGTRTYRLEVHRIDDGASGTVAVSNIRGTIKTEENKLA